MSIIESIRQSESTDRYTPLDGQDDPSLVTKRVVFFLFTRVYPFHLYARRSLFTKKQDHNVRLVALTTRSFPPPVLLWSRWDEEDTSSPGSLVLWLLLAWPIHLPVVTPASGFLPILLPACPPSKQTHSLIPPLSPSLSPSLPPSLPLSSALVFPIWPPGRCVALKQALLIEHLFRHGAGSVACGRAAGGSSRGDIMSYYIS